MKQTLTLKVLVVSSIALAVASGCERRTRPPKTGGGDVVNADKLKGSPSPLPGGSSPSPDPSTSSPSPNPSTVKTDDEKAVAANAAFEEYMKKFDEKNAVDIKIVAGNPATDDAGKPVFVIDEPTMEKYFADMKAKIEAKDAETLKKFANPEAVTTQMKANLLGQDATDPSKNGLSASLDKFIGDQEPLVSKVKDEAIAKATKENIAKAVAIKNAIPAAVKKIESLL